MRDAIYLLTTYDFIIRAFLAGLAISICASVLGVTIVLKRLSMIGDGLSHISFGAIAFATALGFAPMKLAIPLAAVVSVLLFHTDNKKMKGDSGIALISAGALSIGIIMISYNGSSADMNNYLIGSLYSVKNTELYLSLILCAVVLICFVFMYHRIFAVTFDEDFSRATGIKTKLYTSALAILTSLCVVVGMRLMGALLISALMVFPALSSMRVFKSFLSVTICSVIISLISFVSGFCLTLILDAVPTGACITLTNLVIFIIMWGISFVKK